jgi:hypothetical protein
MSGGGTNERLTLFEMVKRLSERQVDYLCRVAEVLAVPATLVMDPSSDLSPVWAANFGAAPADIVRVAGGVVTDLKRA